MLEDPDYKNVEEPDILRKFVDFIDMLKALSQTITFKFEVSS